MEKITIRKPDDFHVHLRDGDMLKSVARYTAEHFGRALVMPNTLPRAILTAEDAVRYKKKIQDVLGGRYQSFEPLMTIKITSGTTPGMIREAKEAGVIAGKVYPAQTTTNSDDGIKDFYSRHFLETLSAMQEAGMVLCVHGEDGDAPSLKREAIFIDRVIRGLAKHFRHLKIVVEHISTRRAIEFVRNASDNVAATIAIPHLFLTIDDVIGRKLEPHHFCKPIPKTKADKFALCRIATSGHPKFFLGTDSAPHLKINKECRYGAAGVFTAPVALSLLAELFEKHNKLDRLEKFTSVYGAQFYGLPLNKGEITLVKSQWDAPSICDGDVVPFKAGRALAWRVP